LVIGNFSALQFARARLSTLDDAAITATALLAHVLKLTRAQVLARVETPLTAEQARAFEGLVDRAALGEPLAYLTGRREFCGLDFDVDVNVLVPRPETERLVELAIAARPRRALDVGTGSGCIAVALAVHLPQAAITASDLSPQALEVARHNAQRHSVEQHIQFIQSDLLDFLHSPTSPILPSKIVSPPTSPLPPPFDLICANLPYIDRDELRGMPVARFEPRLALDGGPGGLALIQRLLGQAPAALAPGGLVLLEIGAEQGPAATELARAAFPAAGVRVERDLAGLDRVLVIGPGERRGA
jgi:release factor glutamine methyltransferase